MTGQDQDQDQGDCSDEMKLKLETWTREKREAEGAVSDVRMDIDLIPNIKVKAQELPMEYSTVEQG